MTIEIKQLVIRATAEYRPGPTRTAEIEPVPPRSTTERWSRLASPVLDRDALVATCVREVKRKLRKSRER